MKYKSKPRKSTKTNKPKKKAKVKKKVVKY